MKKIWMILLGSAFIVSMTFSIHVKAAELPFVTAGYMEGNIYDEASGKYAEPNATTMPITRTVPFEGNVTPPEQLPWKETINGIEYSGTLTRNGYVYMRKDNITIATYKGILTYYLHQ